MFAAPSALFPPSRSALNDDSGIACEGLFSGVQNVRVIVGVLGALGLLHAHTCDIAASRITT